MKKLNKNIKLVTRILFSIFIIGFILYGMRGDLSKVKVNVLSTRWQYFSLAVFLYIIVSILGSYRLHVLLMAHNIKVRFTNIVKNIYLGYLFNLFLLGSTGGDAIRSYYIARETHKKTEIITLVFFDRIIGLTTMMCIALVSLMFNLDNPQLRSLAITVIILFVGAVLFFVLILNKNIAMKIPAAKYLAQKLFFKNTITKIYETMNFMKNHKRKIAVAFFLALVVQSIAIFTTYLVAFSMANISCVPLRHFFLLMPVVYIGSALPVSIGGWGVYEMGFVFCFGLIGYAEEVSLSIGLMSHFLLVLLGAIGAVIYIMPGTRHIAAQAIAEGIEGIDEKDDLD